MACPTPKRTFTRLLLKTVLVGVLTVVSSYCTPTGNKTENVALSPDESCLVDAYLRMAEARDIRSVSYETSESLFVVLGAAIDTARVWRTVRALNANPDRWLVVFRSIERAKGSSLEDGPPSE